MARISHFEITSPDPQASAAFYDTVFGWSSSPSPHMPEYLVVQTGDERLDGGLMNRNFQSQPSILWVEVEDLKASIQQINELGGEADSEPGEIPGRGLITYAKDPQGTVFGLIQPVG